MTRGHWWTVGLVASLIVVAAVGLAAPVARWLRPAPRLDRAIDLVSAGRQAEAEAELRRLIELDPDPSAGLLLAQLLNEGQAPRADEILAVVDRVEPRAEPALRPTLLVQKGKALYRSYRLPEAEAAWDEALRLDPMVAEAGWLLIQLYDVEGRAAEARLLALRLSAVEPEPVDQVRLLLEPIRIEVDRLNAASKISWLEPALGLAPDDFRLNLAIGRAYNDEGRFADARAALQRALARHPEDEAAWDAWLDAQEETESLRSQLERVPPSLRDRPSLAAHRGELALDRLDYAGAVAELRRALEAEPTDSALATKLGRALKFAGATDEAEGLQSARTDHEAALAELDALYEEAIAIPTLGIIAEPKLYQRLAGLRERLGRPDEARLWHELALRSAPGDPASLEALARLDGRTPAADAAPPAESPGPAEGDPGH